MSEIKLSEKEDGKEKRIQLYLSQVKLLDGFLANGAITKAQYDKSFGDLTEKMGMREYAPKR